MFESLRKIVRIREPAVAAGPVLDLDDIIEKPMSFKLHGKIHSIKPLKVEEVFNLANAFTAAQKGLAKTITAKELIEHYVQMFAAVSDTITREDIEKCTQGQIAALLIVLLDRLSGKNASDIADVSKMEASSVDQKKSPLK